MMDMQMYVAWRLFAAKLSARNLRIIAFVRSGLQVAFNDTPWTRSLGNIYR